MRDIYSLSTYLRETSHALFLKSHALLGNSHALFLKSHALVTHFSSKVTHFWAKVTHFLRENPVKICDSSVKTQKRSGFFKICYFLEKSIVFFCTKKEWIFPPLKLDIIFKSMKFFFKIRLIISFNCDSFVKKGVDISTP